MITSISNPSRAKASSLFVPKRYTMVFTTSGWLMVLITHYTAGRWAVRHHNSLVSAAALRTKVWFAQPYLPALIISPLKIVAYHTVRFNQRAVYTLHSINKLAPSVPSIDDNVSLSRSNGR